MHIDIEWDAAKAAGNLRKHGVSFEEAATVLLDPVAYALRGADRIRLNSARRATRSEAGEHA